MAVAAEQGVAVAVADLRARGTITILALVTSPESGGASYFLS